MKNKIIVRLENEDRDEAIYLSLSKEGVIVGINFHFGIDEVLPQYEKPCVHITEIFLRLAKKRDVSINYLDNTNRDDLMAVVSDAIDMYWSTFVLLLPWKHNGN